MVELKPRESETSMNSMSLAKLLPGISPVKSNKVKFAKSQTTVQKKGKHMTGKEDSHSESDCDHDGPL